jgi:hypothetical protein
MVSPYQRRSPGRHASAAPQDNDYGDHVIAPLTLSATPHASLRVMLWVWSRWPNCCHTAIFIAVRLNRVLLLSPWSSGSSIQPRDLANYLDCRK